MAADRNIPVSGTKTGTEMAVAIQEEFTALFNAAPFLLTSIGGTADAITATLAPPLTAGIVDGMRFSFVAASTNTGAVTIDINGGGAVDVVNDDGDALGAGQIVAGRIYDCEASGGDLRLKAVALIQKTTDYQDFTASGTWTKPAGTSNNALVVIHVWGAGGGGGANAVGGGGGGGGFVQRIMKAGDLASTVTVTVGTGGAVNSAGGQSSFGAHAIAFGGGAGENSTSAGGGGGGGPFAQGGNGASATGGAGGGVTLGAGGNVNNNAQAGIEGGGGGGAGGPTLGGGGPGRNGGNAVYGGAGGASPGSGGPAAGTAGISLFGGNGGATGVAGSAPGGGGGRNAAGARGEVRVWTIG